MRESAACLSMQADIGTFLAFRLDLPLPRNSTFFFFLSFAQPPAVYNRVCKSSHSGRVKQSSRNRGLLSRSADFLHSIGGNRFGYLDPKPSRSSNPTHWTGIFSDSRIVSRESANARQCILYCTFELHQLASRLDSV